MFYAEFDSNGLLMNHWMILCITSGLYPKQTSIFFYIGLLPSKGD